MPAGRGNMLIKSNQIHHQQSNNTRIQQMVATMTKRCPKPRKQTPPSGGAGIESNHPNAFQQILQVPRNHRVLTVFNDSKILTTWGYAMLKTSLKYNGEKTSPGIATSMSRLTVDRPYLYIPHGTIF
ncbi:hypothetical protein MRX96_000004 [Rhipicephalus microplus]